MSVDLFLQLNSKLPDLKPKLELVVKKIKLKYSLIDIDKEMTITFNGIRVCEIFPRENEIQFSTNAAYYDYLFFIVCAFAKELGVDGIDDPTSDKKIPIENPEILYGKLQKIGE